MQKKLRLANKISEKIINYKSEEKKVKSNKRYGKKNCKKSCTKKIS